MLYWTTLLTLILLCLCMAGPSSLIQPYILAPNTSVTVPIQISATTRLTLIQFTGNTSLILKHQHKKVTFASDSPLDAWLIGARSGEVEMVLQAGAEWTEGRVELVDIETVELLTN